MKGFYITVSNGLVTGDHRKRMGIAVFEFMWLLDKMTSISEEGVGKVLGGKPIKLEDIGKDQETSNNTVSTNLNRLKNEGYINLKRTPYGLVVSINKAQKVFGQRTQIPRDQGITENLVSGNQEVLESLSEDLVSNSKKAVNLIRQDSKTRQLDSVAKNKFFAGEDSPSKELALANENEKEAAKPHPSQGAIQRPLTLPHAGNVTHMRMGGLPPWQEFDVSWFSIPLQNLPKATAEMIDKSLGFYKIINPDYEDLYANKTERNKQTELLERYGMDKIEIIINILPEFKKQPYQKVKLITKPSDLRKTMSYLLQAIIEKQGQNQHEHKIEKYHEDKEKENKEGYGRDELLEEYYVQQAKANSTTVEQERERREKEQAEIQEAIRLGKM